jgi:hypothetical protein
MLKEEAFGAMTVAKVVNITCKTSLVYYLLYITIVVPHFILVLQSIITLQFLILSTKVGITWKLLRDELNWYIVAN